jgi:uncharacterized membrane protein
MPMQATTTTPLFAAELTPNRSLSARGGWIVLGLVALLAALPALAFLSMGAWPIVGFMGLDVLAIAIALYVAMRRGKRREQITVWADQLEWTATDAKGAKTLRRFNPKTVRLLLDRDADEKTVALRLRQGKDELEVGAFLKTDEKSSFSKALGTALRRARA